MNLLQVCNELGIVLCQQLQPVRLKQKLWAQVLLATGLLVLLLVAWNFPRDRASAVCPGRHSLGDQEMAVASTAITGGRTLHFRDKVIESTVQTESAPKLPQLPSLRFYINALNLRAPRRNDSFDPHISAAELRAMIDLTWAFLDLCESLGIRAILYGGTLLGSYRHHGVMPWDDDTDFLLEESDQGMLEIALANASSGLSLTKYGRWKVWNKTNCIIRHRGRKYCWPFVDLSFYHRHGDKIYDTVKAFGWNYSYPVSLTFPLHKRPFMGRWVDSPRDALGFLGYDKTPSDQCISLTYSHKFESNPTKKVVYAKCASLRATYPFVIRVPGPETDSQGSSGVLEVLRFDKRRPAYSVFVEEPAGEFNAEYSILPLR